MKGLNLGEPVRGMKWALYPLGDITQWYGKNEALYTRGLKESYPEYYEETGGFVHSGVDIVRKFGERLYAVDDGIITHVRDDASGYGKHVRLRTRLNDEIDIDWVYGHNSYNTVKKGDFVKKGQLIGLMGNTGFVISGNTAYWGTAQPKDGGVHCHFGGRYVNRRTGEALDYFNKAFGRIDPLPLFRDPELTSSKVLALASERQNMTLFQFSQLLRTIKM